MTLPDWQAVNLNAVSPVLDEWAGIYNLPRSIVYGLVSQESRFNPNAIGDAGRAHGLTQIWLTTAGGIGYSGDGPGLQDPNTNVQFGLLYLRNLLDRFGDMDIALSAYNGGFKNNTITNPAYVTGVTTRAAYFDDLWNAVSDPAPTDSPDATGDGSTNGSGVVAILALIATVYGVAKLVRM